MGSSGNSASAWVMSAAGPAVSEKGPYRPPLFIGQDGAIHCPPQKIVVNTGRTTRCQQNLGLLHALKGVGNRALYRWLTRDYRALFPHLPDRTRLFRLFKTHQAWTFKFLA